MKKTKLFLSILLLPALLFAQNWDGTRDISWYNSSSSTFTITTAEQLAGLRQLTEGWNTLEGQTFILGNDIMINDTIDWQSWNESSGIENWLPIGQSSSNTFFAGTFDGNGYVISGVYINNTSNYQGLFGYVNGTIKNLGVKASYIKGQYYVGGLAGRAENIISSYATGKVSGNSYVGGLVGQGKYITSSYAAGSVSGSGYLGGLAGESEANAGVTNSYATGSVSGSSGYVGGLVGLAQSGVTNSYATGSVSGGGEYVGGLVGRGYWLPGIVNSYYSVTTGQTDTGKGESRTDVQMKEKTTFNAWDFENDWEINASINGGMPHLPWQSPVGQARVQISPTEYEYTGSQIIPTSVTVKLNGNTVASTEFVLEYGENLNAFTGGTVTITGKTSAFFGKKTVSFVIFPKVTVKPEFIDIAPLTAVLKNSMTLNDISLPSGYAWLASATPITEADIGSKPFSAIYNNPNYEEPSEAGTIYVNIVKAWDGTTASTTWYTTNQSASSYTITTAEELAGLRQLVNGGNTFSGKTINLGNDIFLNDTIANGGWQNWGSSSSGLKQWTPIGIYSSSSSSIRTFQGTFDGNGKVISGLYINPSNSSSYQGLFGYVGSDGTIKNLGITASCIGSNSGYSGYYAGGLAGLNYGTISNSYAVVNVSSNSYNSGGLVGENGGKISNSYAVKKSSGLSGGGLVGLNYGTISNSYASGYATDNSTEGYLFGNKFGGTVINSYSEKNNKPATITDGYCVYGNGECHAMLTDDLCESGTLINSCEIGGRGEPKTTAEMKQHGTYAAWDFDKVWGMGNPPAAPLNNGMPYLQWQGPIGQVQVAQISPEPYKGQQIKPTPEVKLNGKTLEAGKDFEYEYGENVNVLTGGTVTIAGKTTQFFGRKTVNFSIVKATEGKPAFLAIAAIEATLTSTLTLADIPLPEYYAWTVPATQITGNGLNQPFDAIYRSPNYVNPSDPGTVHVNVSSKWDGRAADTTWYTSNKGASSYTITTPVQLAGLALLVNGSEKNGIYNMSGKTIILGNDIALNDTTGWQSWNASTTGLKQWTAIGSSYGVDRWGDKEINSFKGTFDGNGKVISGVYINKPDSDYQGLFGYCGDYSGTIKNLGVRASYIEGNEYVGSLAGRCIISNSYATGNVSGYNYVGGLVGYSMDYLISSSYATGNVWGYNYVGGLVGISYGISNSYATGNVWGYNYVGGLVGENSYSSSKIINSYATGNVSATGSRSGGLVGYNSSSEIINSYYNLASGKAGSGTGKALEEMKMVETYIAGNWDFSEWAIHSSLNNGYPVLQNIWYDQELLKITLANQKLTSDGKQTVIVRYVPGSPATPAVESVALKGTALTATTDYTVQYLNNSAVGTAQAIIIGKNGYSVNAKGVAFQITNGRDLADVTVEPIRDQIWRGSPIIPELVIKDYGGTVILQEGTDYDLMISGNNKLGEAKITIVGGGIYEDSDFRIITFNIVDGYELTGGKATITLQGPSEYTYDGTEHKPSVTVNHSIDGVLVEDKDYTLSYSGNINAGVANAGSVTATGKGDYKGTLSATFTINKKAISEVSVAEIPTMPFADGEQVMPELILTDGERTLILNTDYEITGCLRCTAVGTNAAVLVSGKGNYSGNRQIIFAISDVEIEKINIAVVWSEPFTFVYNGESHVPAATAKRPDGSLITLNITGGAINAKTESYTATAQLATPNPLYNLTNSTHTFTITKAAVIASLNIADVEEGQAVVCNTTKVTGNIGGGAVTCYYSSTAEGVYTTEAPTTLGTWFAYAAIAETDNYLSGRTETVQFTIDSGTPALAPQIATGNISVKTTGSSIILENLPKNAKIEVYNLQGKQIHSAHPENPSILKIQVQTGMYIIKASFGSETKMLRAVVK